MVTEIERVVERLRERMAIAKRTRPDDHVAVQRQELAALLAHIDQLNADLREAVGRYVPHVSMHSEDCAFMEGQKYIEEATADDDGCDCWAQDAAKFLKAIRDRHPEWT